MRTGVVYTLRDPRTLLVRYVGCTVAKPNTRYNQHIYQWKRCIGKMTRVNSWIKALADLGLKPILNIEEEYIPETELENKEIQYIYLYKSIGACLCNHTIGGRGISGFKMSKASKAKRLKTLETSILWKERGARHSQIMRDRYNGPVITQHTEETKKKISIASKANKRGLEALARNREKLKKGILVDNLYFDSLTAAANFIGVVPNSVRAAARKGKLCKGYRVKFENKTQHELKSKATKKD